MAGLVPAIHECPDCDRVVRKTWMPGTSTGMTVVGAKLLAKTRFLMQSEQILPISSGRMKRTVACISATATILPPVVAQASGRRA